MSNNIVGVQTFLFPSFDEWEKNDCTTEGFCPNINGFCADISVVIRGTRKFLTDDDKVQKKLEKLSIKGKDSQKELNKIVNRWEKKNKGKKFFGDFVVIEPHAYVNAEIFDTYSGFSIYSEREELLATCSYDSETVDIDTENLEEIYNKLCKATNDNFEVYIRSNYLVVEEVPSEPKKKKSKKSK